MQGGSTTKIATVLATLLEGLPGVMPAGVEILDGDSAVDQPDDALIIGPATPDIPGYVVTYTATKTRQPVQVIEIALVARSFAGDQELAPRRARCADIIAGVQTYIRLNPRVEGRWDQIEAGSNELWHPVYTPAGVNCYVGFSIVTSGLL